MKKRFGAGTIGRFVGLSLIALLLLMSPLYALADKKESAETTALDIVEQLDENPGMRDEEQLLDVIRDIPEIEMSQASFERMLGNKKIKRERIAERTSKSKTFELEDGSLSSLHTLQNMHFVNEYGEWQEINPVIVRNSRQPSGSTFRAENQLTSGMYEIEGLPYTISLPINFSYGYSIGDGEDQMAFIPVGVRDSYGRIDSSSFKSVTYENAWTDTDVELVIKTWGVKENLILRSEQSPTEFSFEIIGTVNESLQGSKVTILPAWLVDAAGTERRVEQQLRTENGRQYLDLSVDTEGLQYPVTVDPTGVHEELFMTEMEPMAWEIELDTAPIISIDFYVDVITRHLSDFEYWTNTVYGYEEMVYPGGPNIYYLPPDAFSLDNNILYLSGGIGAAFVYLNIHYEDTPSSQPQLLHPNGGEILSGTSFLSLTVSPWISELAWRAQISLNGGATWQSLSNRLVGSRTRDGDTITTTLNLRGLPRTDQALVRVQEDYLDDWDTSDQTFTIHNVVELVSPNGGEFLSETLYITGTLPAEASVQDLDIEISLNGGLNWFDAESSILWGDVIQNGYTFKIPVMLNGFSNTNNALIRIRENSLSYTGNWAISEHSFTIGNKVELLSPNGGEILAGTSSISIHAPSAVDEQNLEIEISLNGGVSWESLNGLIQWSGLTRDANVLKVDIDTEQLEDTTAALIRVRESYPGYIGEWDTSNQMFTIANRVTDADYFYDRAGRLEYILLSNGKKMQFTYDQNGNLLSQQWMGLD